MPSKKLPAMPVTACVACAGTPVCLDTASLRPSMRRSNKCSSNRRPVDGNCVTPVVFAKMRGSCSAISAFTSCPKIVANSARTPPRVPHLLIRLATSAGVLASTTFAVVSGGNLRQFDSCRSTTSGNADRSS